MSAFSRGCLLRHQCAFKPSQTIYIFQRSNLQQHRLFSAASAFRAAKKAAKPSSYKSKAPPNNKSSYTPSPSATYVGYAQMLSQKSHPTVLYEAPSHTALKVASYSTSLFCFSWAGITYWNSVVYAPADISPWVPHAFMFLAGIMLTGGFYVGRTPAGIVRTISAIPKSMQVASGAKTAASASDLQIEIELKKMFPLPFFPARKIYASPSELSLPSPLSGPADKSLTAAEQRAIQKQNELLRQKELEYERTHIMTQPFRQMSRGAFSLFKEMKRMFHREGFMKLSVKGKKYKLDITDGWALDNGRAIDRLVGRKQGA